MQETAATKKPATHQNTSEPVNFILQQGQTTADLSPEHMKIIRRSAAINNLPIALLDLTVLWYGIRVIVR